MKRTGYSPALHSCLLAGLFIAAAIRPAFAQSGTAGVSPGARQSPVGTPHHITTAPTIDGRLNEAVWQSGEPFAGFVQRELHEGEPVSERTEVRVLNDGEAVYIGAWLFDREPDGIVPGEKVRDVDLNNSDYFAVILDTYLDRQNGFIFATTPAGIEYDGQVVKEGEGGGVSQTGQTRAQAGAMGGFNINWDGSWTIATSRDSLGWYAEFRIPFSTLRFGGGAKQRWGLNLARSIRRKNEDAYWSFIPRQFNLYRLSRAGTLDGLEVPVRRVATATPYVLGGAQRDYVLEDRAQRLQEAGIDLKYGVTPSLTLDLTYNTDFAQVEVDEQRTNLTRFPLFFPEKRPFFLENSGSFSAGTPQAADLFFSRRIGIDTIGNPVSILGGGRLTGRVAGMTVGALQIFTDSAPTAAANSFSVARATRELSSRSRVGVIAVQRVATKNGADRNHTIGVDGRVGAGDAWTLDWWGAKTVTPTRGTDDLGYSTRIAYQTGSWNNNARIVQVGRDFNPEVGFLNRSGGYRFYEVSLMRLYRNPALKWLKDWNPHGYFRGYFGLDSAFFQSGQVHVDVTELELANGGRIGPEFNVYHEGLQKPFAIARTVTLPVGSYDWAAYGFDWSSNPSAPLSITLRGDFGPFYNGTRNGGNATIIFRRGATLTSSLLLDYNDVRLDEGRFTRYLVGTRLGYYFTPRVFLLSLVQYNNQARVLTANARFGWLNTAGTGLFVVFNDGHEADGVFDWVKPQARSLVVKYTRQFGSGT